MQYHLKFWNANQYLSVCIHPLCNISWPNPFLTGSNTAFLACALVTSQITYCNFILWYTAQTSPGFILFMQLLSLPEHAPTHYSHPITTSLAFCTMPHYFKILLLSIALYIHLSPIYLRSHTQFFLLHCSHHLLETFQTNCFSFLELACTTVTISIIFKRRFY